jgi:hypothetical protein
MISGRALEKDPAAGASHDSAHRTHAKRRSGGRRYSPASRDKSEEAA